MKKIKIKKNSFQRIERKWHFKSENLNKQNLIISLSRSSLIFKKNYETRRVNSIYFDNNNLSSIIQNIDGLRLKQKFRVRWYGDLELIKNTFFEIKEKVGFVSKKTIIPIKLKKAFKLDTEGLNLIKYQINKILNYKLNLIPILSTHYYRDYFISDNNQIRATLDYNIQSHQFYIRQEFNFKKNYNDYILELKYDVDKDNYVRKFIKENTIRYSKSSKYINCALNLPNYSS